LEIAAIGLSSHRLGRLVGFHHAEKARCKRVVWIGENLVRRALLQDRAATEGRRRATAAQQRLINIVVENGAKARAIFAAPRP